ncbi:uncharacterized protein (DUF169 family) [Scopulibacillus darangshiensis]|uniref:Uncharacterized protein (DUF169 family) n=1 Tax=Scopulibacillus darangshiensis TaxID=442528 RepID=A0A4R2NPU7_9BACL|nr:DUF169 domain-containing protein [Scopulibacillus darangshiensis]TCP23777.1 uncharacterized protein (DUF169 family) [Scopulibacillus darangshiensis]
MSTEHQTQFNWRELVGDLNKYLRLKTIPIGMKAFSNSKEMETIPKIRRPKRRHLLDQIVAQSARLGWTVGITAENLAMKQCGAIAGLMPQDEDWYSGEAMNGIWFSTQEDSAAHQRALDAVPYGKYEAIAVSPLETGRLEPPDICLIYATPGQMITLINGLQWKGYKKFEWSVAGESSCADSWGKALSTGEPSLSIPCYAERRYGGVLDDELLMAIPPKDLVKGIEGMAHLSKNGLRYPIPQYGIQADPTESLAPIYPFWVNNGKANGEGI